MSPPRYLNVNIEVPRAELLKPLARGQDKIDARKAGLRLFQAWVVDQRLVRLPDWRRDFSSDTTPKTDPAFQFALASLFGRNLLADNTYSVAGGPRRWRVDAKDTLDKCLKMVTGKQYAPERRARFAAYIFSLVDRPGDERNAFITEAIEYIEAQAEFTLEESDDQYALATACSLAGPRTTSVPSLPIFDDNYGVFRLKAWWEERIPWRAMNGDPYAQASASRCLPPKVVEFWNEHENRRARAALQESKAVALTALERFRNTRLRMVNLPSVPLVPTNASADDIATLAHQMKVEYLNELRACVAHVSTIAIDRSAFEREVEEIAEERLSSEARYLIPMLPGGSS